MDGTQKWSLAPLPVLPLDQALDPEMGGPAWAPVSQASNTGALLLAWPGRLMLLRGLIGVSSSSGGRGEEATLRQLCSLSPVNPDFLRVLRGTLGVGAVYKVNKWISGSSSWT